MDSYEPVVGINHFANSAPGFTGILKQRYSDFIVREVGLDGNVCVLNDMSTDLQEQVFGAKLNLDKDESLRQCEEQLKTLLDEATIVRVVDFLQGTLEPGSELLIPSPEDKNQRTDIHKCFKAYVADMVSTETFNDSTGKYIRIKPGKSKDRREQWPHGCPEFLQFALYKENIDTPAAINALARNTRCNQDNVGFAGTKDKRAVTTQVQMSSSKSISQDGRITHPLFDMCQWVTLWRRKPRDIARAMNRQTNPTIRVGNFSYVPKALRLGMLNGNRFGIVLRDIQVDNEMITAACESMAQSGFINYFGLQRFGRIGSRTHDLGREILRANWDGLVASLLSVKDYDKPQMAQAKSYWADQRNAKAALEALPREGYIEKALLSHLARFPNDPHGAFNKIAKQTRMLYLHAFQSYIFNQAASYRVHTFGHSVISGDLVMVSGDGSLVTAADDENEKGDDDNEAEAMDRVPAGYRVVVASDEDVAACRYSMSDVVLPLLGHKIQLPSNAVRDHMLELLAGEGLEFDVFTNKKQPQYSLSGAYRRVIEMPKDFQWSIRDYSNGNDHLLPTDLDLLRATEDEEKSAATMASEGAGNQLQGKALCLEFTLPPSTYATMFLRELTKQPTDVEHHAQMTAELKQSLGTKRAAEETQDDDAETKQEEPKRQKS